ncbi:hypothetical protein BDW75DRAFT_235047 [Aspergillus navahoensis]
MQSLSVETMAGAKKARLSEDDFVVIRDSFDNPSIKDIYKRLRAAAEENQRHGVDLSMPAVDPNSSNVRIFYLVKVDAILHELIHYTAALKIAKLVLGEQVLVSRFRGHRKAGLWIYCPPFRLVTCVPEPWEAYWTMNILCCLSGVHRQRRKNEEPSNVMEMLRPFIHLSKAGSMIAMDAGQVNWTIVFSKETKNSSIPRFRDLQGLDATANSRKTSDVG